MDRDEILRLLRERIVAFAASRGQRETAEDLAQDTLVVLEEKYPHVSEVAELTPLAFQVIRFKMAAAGRKSMRRGEAWALPVDELALSNGDDPERDLLLQERRARLKAALAELGERCRTLLKMKLAGRSFEEIRKHFDAGSLNTVYTWDLRCRRQLTEALRDLWEPAVSGVAGASETKTVPAGGAKPAGGKSLTTTRIGEGDVQL